MPSRNIFAPSLSPNGATVCSHRTGRGKEHLAQSPALGRSPISRYLLRPAPDLKPDHLLAKSPECGRADYRIRALPLR